MGKKVKSKLQVILTMIAALLLFLGSFAFIIFCDRMEKLGDGNIPWIWIGIIGFFACDIISIVLIFHIYGDAIYHDMADKDKKYSAVPLSEIQDMSRYRVQKILTARRFKELQNGYFRGNVFTFSKDIICYYVKCVDIAFASGNISETVDTEFQRFDQIAEENKCTCLLLVLYKDQVTREDMETVKELSKNMFVRESVMPARIDRASVIVLVDAMTGRGYFFDTCSKLSITVYAHGCRLLKKYFIK